MASSSLIAKWMSWAPEIRSALRIVAAFMFVQPGMVELFGFPVAPPQDAGTATLMPLPGINALVEVVAGALLLVGLFTRRAAFILAVEMAVAYFQLYLPLSFWVIVNNGITTALYCFVWLYFSAAGPGPWSLDALRGRKRRIHREDDGRSARAPWSILVERWSALAPQLRSVLRIVAAFIFIQPGTMKVFAFPIGMPPDGATAPLLSQMGIGGLLEVVGGALLLVGLFTRPVAFVLSGEMAVAYWQFHFPTGFWTVVNIGAPAALYCFVWLYFSAAGAGPWSLDAMRERGSPDAEVRA